MGSGWKNLQLNRNRFHSPGKNDSKERQPKAESEKVRFRSLEGREITSQLSMDTPEQKVSKRLLGKKHQKLLVQHWLWYAGEQRRRINGTLEP